MMTGYAFGKIFSPEFAARRKKILIFSGLLVIFVFILLRFLNIYGDPIPWTTFSSPVDTLLSFINLHKYPPSLLFLCMTIGPAILLLAVFDRYEGRFMRIVSVYGQVPFFYYVLHFYLLHLLSMALFIARGHSITENTPDVFGIPFHYLIAGEGYSLKIVYLVWISIVIILYPLCKKFSAYKKKNNYGWLSYL
jgi:uncharacterized membrane protein